MPKKVIKLSAHKIAWSYNANTERQQNVIGRRIAEMRTNADLSLADLSGLMSKVGVKVGAAAINKWEMGESAPSSYQLFAICAVFGIRDPRAMFDSTYSSERPRLNEAGRQKLLEYERDLIDSGNYSPVVKKEAKIIQYREMPVSNLPASAGTGAFLDEVSFDKVLVPTDSVPQGADFGVRVSGDSMEPNYQDGEIVWVQRCESLVPGEVGVFLYDGDGYLKVYEEQEPSTDVAERFTDSQGVLHKQRVLVSLNKKYDPKVVSPDAVFVIAGRVLN